MAEPDPHSDKLQQLEEELSRTSFHLFAVTQALRMLGTEMRLERTLELAVDMLVELTRADYGCLMIKERGNLFAIRAAKGSFADTLLQKRLRFAGAVLHWFTGRPQPVLVAGEGDQLPDEVCTGLKDTPRPFSLWIPLVTPNQFVGFAALSPTSDGTEYPRDLLGVLDTLGSQTAITVEKSMLYTQMHDMFIGTVGALAKAIDARDPYTERHSERVAAMSEIMARQIGIDEEMLESIRVAGLLHDVGKIGIREAILGKQSGLDDDEFVEMQTHAVKSENILQPLSVPQFRRVLPWIRHHHEEFASGGYPGGLEGDEIPLPSRIIAVADTYDAMTSDRPYRKGLSHERALDEIEKCSGYQFDPKVVEAFKACDAAGQIQPMRDLA